ncbi:MAG: S24 family peptidase [Burkholderiales bacterium]|nr:S24 family peptidase [Burkholderiales bacterium]MBY0245918.1 S24 family peptidase [Sphingobacteriaceae bacterium]
MNEQEKLQQIRKENLKKIIKDRFGNKVEAYADFMGKNKYVIYAMLWEISNPNHRKITDQAARVIEQKLGLELFLLDKGDDIDVVDDDNLIIPLIDYQESNNMHDLHIHEYERIKLPKVLFSNINSIQELIGFKIPNMDMFPHFSLGDIVVINRAKRIVEDDHAYLVRIDGKFYIRILKTVNKTLYIYSLNKEQQFELDSDRVKIYGIVDVEIRKKLYTG